MLNSLEPQCVYYVQNQAKDLTSLYPVSVGEQSQDVNILEEETTVTSFPHTAKIALEAEKSLQSL